MNLRKRCKRNYKFEETSESICEKFSNKRVKKSSRKSQTKTVINNKGEARIIRRRNRKKRQVTDCPHTDKDHYAKGMCNQCYHILGRSHKATLCEHTELLAYAKGKCQKCYFIEYNSAKALRTRKKSSLVTKEEKTPE